MSMKNYKLVPMDKVTYKEIAQIERMLSTPGVRPHWRRSFTILWPPSIVAQRPDGAVLGYAGLHAS